MCKNESIHIIELKNAHNHFIGTFPLKNEITIIKGIFATAFIPINGAINLNNFREQGQFKFGLVSLKFNNCGTTFNIPVHFLNIQGFIPNEEKNQNYNRQVLFALSNIYKTIPPNSFIKIKYRDSLADVRYIHYIKLYLKYIEKDIWNKSLKY
jgi:hypothetical protein